MIFSNSVLTGAYDSDGLVRASVIVTVSFLGDTIPKYRDLLINSVLTGAYDSNGLVRASVTDSHSIILIMLMSFIR